MQKEIYLSENKKLNMVIFRTGILLIPVALYFVPVEWLNSQHSICLFKNITGHECWGCGMTRSVISAIQLHFEDAFHYNKLVLFIFPVLVYLWAKTLLNFKSQQ